MNKKKLYQSAVERYGIDAQIHVAVEELSELQKALMKYLRAKQFGSKNEQENAIKNIADEIADCEIMTEQMAQFFNIQNNVVKIKKFKKRRLSRRIKKPETIKELIEMFQKRYSKKTITDDVALEVVRDGNQIYLIDCLSEEIIEEGLTAEKVFELKFKSFELNRDYYSDGSEKHALIIEVS